MTVSVNPVVYNAENVQFWTAKLPLLEQQKQDNSQIIVEQEQFLTPLKQQLNVINSQISSAQTLLNVAHWNAVPHHHGHHGNSGVYVLNAMAIGELQSQLYVLESQQSGILNQMQPFKEIIKGTREAQRAIQEDQIWLQRHIPEATLFLRNLNKNPATSLNELQNRIIVAFTTYEDEHLTGLSPQVRISLIATQYGLKLLNKNENGLELMRINYLRMCGFLWDMYYRVAQENKEDPFQNLLKTLLESTHIDENGDLPDHLKTGFTTTAWFEENKSTKAEYFAIPEQDLPNIESQIFQSEIVWLTQLKQEQKTMLQTNIINAAQLIKLEVQDKTKKKEEIDYHFYIRAMRNLNAVYHNFVDDQTAKRLSDIAEYASGSPSIGKQVLGALLVVFGGLLIATCIAGCVTAFASSLFCAWAITLRT